jgi:HEAT repeat protein
MLKKLKAVFGGGEVKQPDGLVRLLLDKGAEFGDRDDAAMDLGQFDEPVAEQALTTIVEDMSEDADIADAAGESLAEIWKRKSQWDADVVSRMHPEAKKFFNWR